MKNVTVGRTVAAPRAAVWAVLADYPNIAEWNVGVEKSYAIGDQTEGVGAVRHCDLTVGAMDETVTTWVDEETMVIALSEIQKHPLKQAEMTFTLAADGPGTTVTMSYNFEPKGGPFSSVVAAMLKRPMNKGFNSFIDDLEAEAQARA